MPTNQVAIGWDNRVDTAVLTADTGENQATIENLKTHDVRELWLPTQTSPALKADFGEPIIWGGTALIKSNALPGDRWHIRLSTVDPVGVEGDAYDSGLVDMKVDPAFQVALHVAPTPQPVGRYLRIDLEQQSGIPSAGRWFAGPVWRPSRAFSYGWQPIWRDASRRTESLGQVIFIDRKLRQRGFRFTLNGITEAEAFDEVHEINRICGTSRDVLVCRDIDNANPGKVTIWGLLEQPVTYQHEHPDFYTAEIEILERL